MGAFCQQSHEIDLRYLFKKARATTKKIAFVGRASLPIFIYSSRIRRSRFDVCEQFIYPVNWVRVLAALALKSIVRNVEEQGFRKLVIVSAHSGSAQHNLLLKLANEKHENMKIFAFPGKDFPGGIDHAGKIETSLMLSIKKSLVHSDKIDKPYVGIEGG